MERRYLRPAVLWGPWEGDASGVKAQFGAGTMQALLLPVVIAPFLTFIATHFVYKTTGINAALQSLSQWIKGSEV